MKLKITATVLLIFSGIVSVCFSQTSIWGNKLDISTTAQSISLTSAAIGGANIVDSGASLAIGNSNHLRSLFGETYQFVVGNNNDVRGNATATVGSNSMNWGYYSMSVGTSNTLEGSAEDGNVGVSLVNGAYNYLDFNCVGVFVSGINNVLSSSYSSGTIGYGLINNTFCGTIVGSYNDTNVSGSLRFAVGNGTGYGAVLRSNAFEVYDNGKILMARQGDIYMGEFGQNGD